MAYATRNLASIADCKSEMPLRSFMAISADAARGKRSVGGGYAVG